MLRIAEGTIVPGGAINIVGNAGGCNTLPEIRSSSCAYTSGDLLISADGHVPRNVTSITRITGDLNIDGTITTFPNFAALEVVEGELSISGITSTSLTALTNIFPFLDSIGGDLTINSTHIRTISGFAALDSVGSGIFIERNNVLESFSGFGALTTLGTHLFINDNAKLTSLPSFSALKSVGDALTIQDNVALTSFSAFSALTSVGGNFWYS